MRGVRTTPAIVLISTLKIVPQKTSEYLATSPMPNQMTTIGIIAVGDRKRMNSRIGSARSCSSRIRPIIRPRSNANTPPAA
jgi:hypothetical protein